MHFGPETELTGGLEAAPLPPLSPGELAPHFPQLEIFQCLGRGGMGVVYKTRQKSLNRFAALKLLAPERANDGEFAKRFTREAHALAALNHPHIVTVYDFGRAGGFYFLLMEFVDGVNLRQAMSAKRFTPKQALAVVPPVCEALQYAHDHGIVHRDIKPENLLLDKEGRIKIADFGIAKILGDESNTGLAESQPAGTPQYMAPEQKDRQNADHRADIYSLGVVLYEMLTGELPGAKLQPPSSKVQIDVRLDEVVLRALEKKPEMRYATAAEFRTQVELATAESSRPSKVPAAASMPWKNLFIATSATVLFSILVAGLLLVIGFWYWRSSSRARAEESLAHARAAEADARASLMPSGTPARPPESPNVTALPAKAIPDPEKAAELSQEGWRLWQQGDFGNAGLRFSEATALSPNDANAWNGYGWARLNSGFADTAEGAFKKAITLEPNNAGALNGLGQIYLSRREYDKAEPFLLKASQQQGASAAWFGLTRLYLLQGKFDNAEKWAQMVVDSGQGDAIATKMLEAAKEKRLSDGLRQTIEPPAPPTKAEPPAKPE
jgi:serine/threonine protein kinase